MGKVIPEGVTPKLAEFIAQQPVFFVATAATSLDHHVNLSPKSPGTSCQVIDSHTVAYADLTGSGSETAAHVLENSRITLLFVNWDASKPPKMVRIHGKAKIIVPSQAPEELIKCFPSSVTTENCGFRAIYVIDVDRVSTSCGFSMPLMHFEGQYRKVLDQSMQKMSTDGFRHKGEVLMKGNGVKAYQHIKNSYSVDGLPSVALLTEKGPRRKTKSDGYWFGEEFSSEEETKTDEDYLRAKALQLRAQGSPFWLRDRSGLELLASKAKDHQPLVTVPSIPVGNQARPWRMREILMALTGLILTFSVGMLIGSYGMNQEGVCYVPPLGREG